MKVLVTGGTGYIGSHTVVELQKAGHEVIIVDNLSNSYASVVDCIEKISGKKPLFEELDLTDIEKTTAFFNAHQDIEAAIHFAASKAVGESVQKPLKYYNNNLNSLLNTIKGMEQIGANKLVFSSSCTVYGQPDQLPVTEQAPRKKALSPYGNTKQICEDIITDYCQQQDMKSILLRYFNPIGAHESALIGELPLGVPDNLVPYITQTAIGIRKQLSVYGDDYNTPDGSAIRDYIHVVDLAKAHVVAVNRLFEKDETKAVEIFNLGTGNGYSVLEAIKSFEKVSGKTLNYKIAARREGDIEQVWADTTFANRELGWEAQLGLDEMMASAWRWELALAK